jgi:TRAP transporter TAXI family solute receptor
MRRIDINHISWRDALVIGVPLALLVALAFWLTSRFVQPAPPDRLVLSTGAAGGDYARFGERYRDYFKPYGVTIELKPSNGSVENAERLNAGKVDAAFVQGGTLPAVPEGAESPIASLGALYPEIVWVFARDAVKATTLVELKGRRIAVGPEGSGLRPLARWLLRESGVNDADATFTPHAGAEAADALERGDVDVVFLIAGPAWPVVVRLLSTPGVHVLPFVRGAAYARRFGALATFTVPRGLSDLAGDLPRADVPTIAVTANLLVRSDLHPALMYLLLDAASTIHGGHTIVADAGEFPNARNQDVPLADEAVRFYRSGKPFLKRYLPYWLANLFDRLIVLLIPILAVLLPVVRFMPAIYEYRLNARIGRWYARLGALEDEIGEAPSPEKVESYLARLDEIESQLNETNFPSSSGGQLYTLRAAIDLVRDRLGKPGAKAIPPLRA